MNEASNEKLNSMLKNVMYWNWENEMRPSWTYMLGQTIIAIAKEEKDLKIVIQDNLSAEEHIDKIFGDTFRMLRNIRMAFHFLDNDMMRKKKNLQ